MSVGLAVVFFFGFFMMGLFAGLFIFTRKFMKNFIVWLRPSVEGNDGKAAGKAITAFIMVGLVIVIVVFYIWFAMYALMREAAISPNELSAAHYPMEALITVASLITALWGIGTVGNAMMTKFTNPQPPSTNVNIQSEKTNVQAPPS